MVLDRIDMEYLRPGRMSLKKSSKFSGKSWRLRKKKFKNNQSVKWTNKSPKNTCGI